MILHWLAKLLGIGGNGTQAVGWDWSLHAGSFSGWIIAAAAILITLSTVLYVREQSLTTFRRTILSVLRALFLLGLLILLLQPTLRFTIEGSVRRELILLIDGTQSMNIQDPRIDPTDLKRAGIALGMLDARAALQQAVPPAATDQLAHTARIDLIKGALANSQLALLDRLSRQYDLRPFTFARTLNEVSTDLPPGSGSSARPNDWVGKLPSDGTSTAIGDALRDVLTRTRGQPLAGVFLITDGANNAGGAPELQADVARQSGVPLYVWGVGLAAPRDIIVSSVYAQEVAFVDDQVAVTVRVRSVGLSGQSADVILKQDDEEVARQHIHFGADGEQVVQLLYTPEKAGDFKLTALVPPRADEVVKDNNQQTTQIRVVDGKIKVLLVERTPRWEFKYLQAMLARDRRVELKCVLQEIDPGLAAAGSIYLPRFPADKPDLFRYDLVIFGDVDPNNLADSDLANLNEYVSKFAGGLLMIAGRQFNPQAYKGTPLEKLLPVETDAAPEHDGETGGNQPIAFELTAAGRAAAFLHLADTQEASDQIWAGLPPIFWDAPVARAKPSAEVLLVDADPARASRFGKMPIIARQQYGLGQVMFVGTDNTWRWRKNAGDKYYTALWGQIAQRLSLPHLLGESKRTQIMLDKKAYSTGDRVTVYARLYSEGYAPVVEPSVSAHYETPGGAGAAPQAVVLRPLPEQPGMYRGEFTAPAAGAYQFSVDRDVQTQIPFTVAEPKLELGDTAMNQAELSEMATTSGGAFLHEEDLIKLPDLIASRSEKVQSTVDVDIWASPLYFLIMLALVTTEWVMRKLSNLK
jgi:hypothetical protein